MKTYRIFLKRHDNIIDDLKLLKESFNPLAFIFNIFYLLFQGLWFQFAISFIILILLLFIQIKFNLHFITIPIKISYFIFLGFEFIDWKSRILEKNGYEFIGYSFGNDTKEAKLRFLENLNNNHPKEDKLEKIIY